MIGHIYPNFSDRLLELSKAVGLCDKLRGLAPALAKGLLDTGIVWHDGSILSYENELGNTRRAIARDIENNNPLRVSGERLDWYCRFFHCSADYLMGYIDAPTYEQKDIQELTGLPDEAARPLLKKERLVVDALTDLLAGLDDPEANDPDNIANVRRSLLYDLHVYLTDPGRITGMFSGFDGAIKEIDGHIFATGTGGTMARFSPDKLPAILMLNIQEKLQEIRNDIQKKK